MNKVVIPAVLFFGSVFMLQMFGLSHPVLIFAVWIMQMLLYTKAQKNEISSRDLCIGSVFGTVFAIALYLGSKIVISQIDEGWFNISNSLYNGSWSGNYFQSFQNEDIYKIIAVIASGCILFSSLFTVLRKRILAVSLADTTEQHYEILKSAGLIFLCWLPYVLSYYPGLIYEDSLNSVWQALGYWDYNNHHPFMYTMFIKLFMKIGQVFGDLNFGCFLYSIAQMIIVSTIFGYSITWLGRHGVPKSWRTVITLFYAIVPVFPLHAISMWKDPLFSAALLLEILLLADVAESKGSILREKKTIFKMILVNAMICFTRNNGIYIVALVNLILSAVYGIRIKSKLKINWFVWPIALVVILWYVISGPIYKACGISDDFEESIGVPLQQMAAVVVYDGNLSEEEIEFMNELMPIEKYREVYTPCCVDHLKWNENFNTEFLENNKAEFIKKYVSLFIKNPSICLKAWMLQTHGFWAVNSWEFNFFEYGLAPEMYAENIGIKQEDLILNTFGVSLRGILKTTFQFLNSSVLTWIVLFVSAMLVVLKKERYLLAMLPLIGTFLTLMIGVPLADWLRYVLIYVYALPVVILLPYVVAKERNKENAYG